jgi:hypothetical protein
MYNIYILEGVYSTQRNIFEDYDFQASGTVSYPDDKVNLSDNFG